jgi:phage gp45-like
MLNYERDIYRNKLFRAEIQETLEDDKPKQSQRVRATGYAGEELEMIRIQPHGFTSWAPKGSLGYAMSIQGRRDLAMSLGFEDPKLRKPADFKEGGVQLYDKDGNHLTMNNNTGHNWEVKGPLTIKVKNLTITVENLLAIKAVDTEIDSEVWLGGKKGSGTLVALCGGACATKVRAV